MRAAIMSAEGQKRKFDGATGEGVYAYVGDEAIVTWPVAKERVEAHVVERRA